MFDWLHPVILFGIQQPAIFLRRCHTGFFSINVCHGDFFLLRSVMVFYAYSITGVQCHPKRNVGWVSRNTIGNLDGKHFDDNLLYRSKTIIDRRWRKIKKIAQCRQRKKKHSCAKISGKVCPQKSVRSSLQSMLAIVFLFNPWII